MALARPVELVVATARFRCREATTEETTPAGWAEATAFCYELRAGRREAEVHPAASLHRPRHPRGVAIPIWPFVEHRRGALGDGVHGQQPAEACGGRSLAHRRTRPPPSGPLAATADST